jgi:glycosyltransferase involved in cell wall biosynthesis
MSLKISYLSASVIPSSFANVVHVLKMGAAWALQGHEVTIFSAGTPTDSENLKQQYGLRSNLKVVASGLPHLGGFNGIRNAWRVRRAVWRQASPDLYYARNPLALAAVCQSGVPFIYEAHAIPSRADRRCLERWLLRQPNCRGLVVITQALRDDLRALYPEVGRMPCIVAPDGADVPLRSQVWRKAWPGREGILQVGYVGSLYRGKGAELLPELARRMPELDFHIAGGSAAQVAELRKERAVANLHLHGHLSHGALPSLFSRLDIMLAPLQPHVGLADGKMDIGRWTSPLKIFEYMAHRKAIIASDLPVLKEILVDGRNALLCRPDSIDDWIAAIWKLQNEAERNALADRAFAEFSRAYTWDARSEMILRETGF